MRITGVAGGLATCFIAVIASAQTRFEWPDATVNVARYPTVEECLAATIRVRDSVGVDGAHDTLPDTDARAAEDARAPLPPPAVVTAARCGARFSPTIAPLTDFVPLLDLYMAAGRDADATVLVQRRLASVGPTAERDRAAVLDTVIRTYLDGWAIAPQPKRLAAAEPLVNQLGQMKGAPWETRFYGYAALMDRAWNSADTALARRMAEPTLAMVSELTAAERRTKWIQLIGGVDLGLRMLNKSALLDSLRHSTAAYAGLYQALWDKAIGNGTGLARRPIGETVPTIEADFWYRRSDSTVVRPVKGKANLVVFLGTQGRAGGSTHSDATKAARLHRLAQRFPDVEATLVAQTNGYFGDTVPPPPAMEAALWARTWFDVRQLTGALAVTNTPFWRLPDPDRRRINRDVPNVVRYNFGRSLSVADGTMFLVDADGKIVDIASVNERQVSPLIEILLNRRLTNHP